MLARRFVDDGVAAVVAGSESSHSFSGSVFKSNIDAADRPALLIGDDALDFSFHGKAIGRLAASQPSCTTQRTSAGVPGDVAMLQRQNAVDEYVFDSRRSSIGIIKGGNVVYGLRVKDGDVCEVIRPEQAAVFQLHALRRQGGKFADGIFQRQHMFLAHVFAKDAWKGAISAGM